MLVVLGAIVNRVMNGKQPRTDYGDYHGPDRRGNGDGWVSGVPTWARAIAVVGIPGAIAIFLVWVGANEIPKIAQQTQRNYDAILRTQELVLQHSDQSAAMFRMLQRICSNTAKSEVDRDRCFDK